MTVSAAPRVGPGSSTSVACGYFAARISRMNTSIDIHDGLYTSTRPSSLRMLKLSTTHRIISLPSTRTNGFGRVR